MAWQPDLNACELVNLRAALEQPLAVRLAYVRSRYVGGPVAEEATLEVAAEVRRLRGELFDGLDETATMISDDHRPGI